MPVIFNRQQNTAGPVPKQNGDRARRRVLPHVWILAAARIRQTESTGLGSHLFWPGFHIRMNVYMQVNENPGGKLQSLNKKVEFISLGFP